MPDRLLIVRHGPGRGRIHEYGQDVLDWLHRERPEIYDKIRLHETGTGTASLEGVAGVCFWLADPLKIKYPACYEEARAIELEAQRRHLGMINRPMALAEYGKQLQARQFSQAAIPTPPAISIERIGDLAQCVDRLGLPLLVRGGQSFSQEGTFIVRHRRELSSRRSRTLPEHAIVTPLVDVRARRAGFRTRDHWGRYYHRKRALLIGDCCVPYSLLFSRDPVVTQETSTYREYHSWQQRLRSRGRLGKRALGVLKRFLEVQQALELESEFAQGPCDHEEVFRRTGASLGLEFLAFDYASLPDGGIVIWEANPYPFIPPARETLLGHSRNKEATARRMYEAFARCFEALIGATPEP